MVYGVKQNFEKIKMIRITRKFRSYATIVTQCGTELKKSPSTKSDRKRQHEVKGKGGEPCNLIDCKAPRLFP